MIICIEEALALAIHERQLAEHGGASGVRDETLLQSALVPPQQRHADTEPSPDLASLAAILAHGLACNHPFVDGNKRTAHACYRTFLLLNGMDVVASEEEKYVAMLSLESGQIGEDGFAAWLRPRLQPHAPHGAHETRGIYKVKRSARAAT